NVGTEAGATGNVVQKLFLAGQSSPINFTAKADKPWLTVTPSSGILPPEGLTLTLTANPSVLNLGTNTGTIQVTYGATTTSTGAKTLVTTVNIPISVSIVTPVSSGGKNTPTPDSPI